MLFFQKTFIFNVKRFAVTGPLIVWVSFLWTDLDKLQVGERPDVEVGDILLQREAVVELAAAAADGERVGPVRSAQRARSVQAAEVGRRAKLCKQPENNNF